MSRNFLTTGLVSACLMAIAAPSFAADIPRRSTAQPAYNQTPPAFTWTGFYLGANAGAIWGDHTKAGSFINTKTGFTGGLTAGYNQQFGQFVAGVEGDYNYSGLSGRGFLPLLGTPVRSELTSFGTLRGRLGVAFDRTLVYGTGGYAFGFSSTQAGLAKNDSTHQGYVVGAGVEYAFTQNVSLKAEYLYMPLGNKTLSVLPGFVAGTRSGIDASVVRAGVNYRF